MVHSQSTRTRVLLASTMLLSLIGLAPKLRAEERTRLRPYAANPSYWEYKGKPVVLLGGTDDDNLFQWPQLEKQLDLLHSVGGNYIRNTMSDRPDQGFEVYPFRKVASGKYDLEQWNEEYWTRFANMLRWTADRDIIVQVELWDRFDYSDHRGVARWGRHPYNPESNINYTAEQVGLKTTYKKHPGSNEQPFFYSVPRLRNNTVLLKYQQAQIDKLLSHSLPYGHVLYCIDNETSGDAEWGRFWAKHVRQRAREANVSVQVTEMWDAWDLKNSTHRQTFDHPDLYSFVDISQNNHNKGQVHWDNLQWVRSYLAKRPRPINTVKIYGADTGRFGNGRDGLERFWRNILGGVAATRFHRPTSGLGLSPIAQTHLKSMRLLLAELDIFRCQPDAASRLLSDRTPSEAYLTRIPGKQYAVYFPDGGQVKLDLREAKGEFLLRWLDIAHCRWQSGKHATAGASLSLAAPGSGHWVALLKRD